MNCGDDFFIVDGSSFLFRAFYALPDLRSPSGSPTGAIYGIVNMLNQLRKKHNPKHLVCVFDTVGETFRHRLYPQYKANRGETPKDLVLQIAAVHNIIALMGIKLVLQTGIEADDIIGTLATLAIKHIDRVTIVTGDKDFAQLVSSKIVLLNTMNNELLDYDGVYGKFGVLPNQIVDYLTLVGDAVDNIPGVAKCGPKTAAKWLTQYGSLDNIIINQDKIIGTVGDNLRSSCNWLTTARQLVTIDTNTTLECLAEVSISEFIDSCVQNEFNYPKLQQCFQELGFKNFLKQDVIPSNNTPKCAKLNLELSVIDTYVMLETFVKQHAINDVNQYLGINVVSGDNGISLIGLTFKNHVYVIDVERLYLEYSEITIVDDGEIDGLFENNTNYNKRQRIDDILREIFTCNAPKVVTDGCEILNILRPLGFVLCNIKYDLVLVHYLKNSTVKHDISSIYQEYLEISISPYPGFGVKILNNSHWKNPEAKDAQIKDCYIVSNHILELEAYIRSMLNDQEMYVYQQIEIPLIYILNDIEHCGIKLDLRQFSILKSELMLMLKDLEANIYKLAQCVFNINSSRQLQDVLFNRLNFPTDNIKKNTNGFSVDEESLHMLKEAYPIASDLLQFRTYSKLLNTYIVPIPNQIDVNKRVHTRFSQRSVTSGRLSSVNPNLQNIPIKHALGHRIREGFIASDNSKLVIADYSQIELRILAHLSQDQNLIHAFQHGLDIHNITACEIFQKDHDQITEEERRYAKTINFSLIYGKSVFGLASELSIDRKTAKNYIDAYFAKYPKVLVYLETLKSEAKRDGFVSTILGRRIYLADINAGNRMVRDAALRLATNAPMQGSAADIIKLAMIQVHEFIKKHNLKSKIVLQVHDELVLDVLNSEIDIVTQALPNLMNNVVELLVPLEVKLKVSDSWGS